MTPLSLHFIVFCTFSFTYGFVLISSEDVAKLPFCSDDVKHTELIFVSTLDGFLTALKPSGTLIWSIETGPGPLLSSSIHHLELTNNGQWIRLIPSLSGGLYKFDGITIDAIPITAESLLKSSFRYSDDLVVAGGKEVRTYGILINSGQSLYECSWDGCKNTTDNTEDLDDVIIIERKTNTVRAVEPRTGIERWNFSVGQHNIKIPYVSCINNDMYNVNLNISAILPEGLLVVRQTKMNIETAWQHKFESPIVAIWNWNGRDLLPMNLFNNVLTNAVGHSLVPSIYVGMHDNQLYVHESPNMQSMLQLKYESSEKVPVADSKSLTQIPWKPVPAASMLSNNIPGFEDSTALSVLYASEYVNGNGYYLYSIEEEKPVCNLSNLTSNAAVDVFHFSISFLHWWKETLVMLITLVIVFKYLCKLSLHTILPKNTIEQQPIQHSNHSISYPDSDDLPFPSRYLTEFDPISCLGKGGFGVVFEAKKKFDECNYAVKRITLPNKPEARERMMREVKALAKLDHRNIVRYYNAWLEFPPINWQHQYDKQWLRDYSSLATFTKPKKSSAKIDPSALTINLEEVCGSCPSEVSSSIVFQNHTSSPSKSPSVVFKNDDTQHSKHFLMKNSEHSNQHATINRPVFLYIQMQLCCKESLKDWLKNNQSRDRFQTLNIFEQIVEAVEYVHFRGLIHRDLKPSNIFFSLEGQIKVGDFGLVTSIKEYSDSTDELSPTIFQKNYTNAVGTQLYMSPEQLSYRQYDYKVDIYSLGIILFELLISFNTEMERVLVLEDLKRAVYPKDFSSNFNKEHKLLKSMLADNPKDRPTATGVRERLIELEGTHSSEEYDHYKALATEEQLI